MKLIFFPPPCISPNVYNLITVYIKWSILFNKHFMALWFIQDILHIIPTLKKPWI